jgi:hypothetical protein
MRFPRAHGWLEQLLHTHDTPRRTAAAYALGVFFGFSPFLGLHTVLGLAFAFALNLNRVAVLLGIYSNLPWLVPAYYTVATIGGALLLGAETPPGLRKEFTNALTGYSWAQFQAFLGTLSPLFWSYTIGSTIGAVLLAAAAYRLSLTLILARRRHHQTIEQ